ncbi:hypothetical protein RHGRI_021632 [Rhododendron griersonianum]|uniref:Protein CutA, chloroplastic n=1 Tax=Rhododendron griersonianum TaxID=479676 RepID=A0AAV6JSI6_9ERIC|nr:hypothetical protein RHGRI_021632 [Rhododendron griersonianum]
MALASTLSSIVASPTLRRRGLPLVGAFCVLTVGLCNLYRPSLLSLSSATGCSPSLPLSPLSRSNCSGEKPEKGIRGIRMEASGKTVPSKKLAESLVKEKLAACVNRVPGIFNGWLLGIESVYQWRGEIQTDSEELLIIKTRESLLEAVKEHVKANHEYEVPEVIALPIIGGSIPYLEWLKNSTRD